MTVNLYLFGKPVIVLASAVKLLCHLFKKDTMEPKTAKQSHIKKTACVHVKLWINIWEKKSETGIYSSWIFREHCRVNEEVSATGHNPPTKKWTKHRAKGKTTNRGAMDRAASSKSLLVLRNLCENQQWIKSKVKTIPLHLLQCLCCTLLHVCTQWNNHNIIMPQSGRLLCSRMFSYY